MRRSGPGRVPGAVSSVETGLADIHVRGWVRSWSGRPPEALWLCVDREVVGSAVLNLPTPQDEAGRLYVDAPRDGWAIAVPLERLPAGRVVTRCVVMRGRGVVDVFPGPILEVGGPTLLGGLLYPNDGDQVSELLTVHGWSRPSLGVDRVEVEVEGRCVAARLLVASHDHLSVLPDIEAPALGWQATIMLSPVDDRSERDITLTAWASQGGRRSLLGEATVRVAAPSRAVDDLARVNALRQRTLLLARRMLAVDSRRHVLVATHHLGIGGGQLYLQDLLRRLVSDGGLTCTVLSQSDGPLRDELEQLGMPVHVVGAPPVTGLAYEAWFETVCALALSVEPTAVIANTAGAYWGVDLASVLDVPAFWAIHESFTPEHFVEVGFPGRADEWAVERFRAAFATAERVVFEADSTMALFRSVIPEGRAVRVDYGIELDDVGRAVGERDRVAVRQRFGISPDESVLLCVGTYEPRKAQAVLVRAFADVVAQFPRSRLVLVGDQPGPYSDLVHHLAIALGVLDRVTFVPITSGIEDWYVAADAMVLASDIESLSRSMLEAMAFGTPVVVSAVFGHAEVIEDGQTGLLFDPTSMTDVALALRRFLAMPASDRAALASRAKEWVRGQRDSTGYAAEYARMIEECWVARAERGVVGRHV